jgi:hypothetical protein
MPEPPVPPTQLPFIAKHPLLVIKLIPPLNVEVAVPCIVRVPVANTLPATDNLSDGDVVPKPKNPLAAKRPLST